MDGVESNQRMRRMTPLILRIGIMSQFQKGWLISSSISNVDAGKCAAAGNDGVPVGDGEKSYRLGEEYFRRATRIIEVNRRVVSGVLTIIFIMQFYRIFGALKKACSFLLDLGINL